MAKKNKKSRPKKSEKSARPSGINVSGYYSIILFLFLVIIDRITKVWALTLPNEKDYGLFSFTLAMNTGAGFGIFQNGNTLLIWVSIIVLGAMIYFKEHFPRSGFILIAAGTLGNLLDRISYGYVIDFINFKFWPIFNAADSFISIGVIITAIAWWKKDRKNNQNKNRLNNRNKSIRTR